MPKKVKNITKKKPEPAIKKELKGPASKKLKITVAGKAKGASDANAKNTAKGKTKGLSKLQAVIPVIAHGEDHHFIPAHINETLATIHNAKKEEKQFHHKEEIALNQEKQKAKFGMTSRMGRKRIFRIQGKK